MHRLFFQAVGLWVYGRKKRRPAERTSKQLFRQTLVVPGRTPGLAGGPIPLHIKGTSFPYLTGLTGSSSNCHYARSRSQCWLGAPHMRSIFKFTLYRMVKSQPRLMVRRTDRPPERTCNRHGTVLWPAPLLVKYHRALEEAHIPFRRGDNT